MALWFAELNKAWADAVRRHATTPLVNDEGKEYLPIGAKSLALLDGLRPFSKKAKSPEPPDLGKEIEAGKRVVFWADPHFGHERIIELCDRPFATGEEMDSELMGRLEAVAKWADRVVCLGDLSMKNPFAVHRGLAKRLGSKHVMLVGNHDAKGVRPEQWDVAGAMACMAFSLSREWLRDSMSDVHGDLAEAVDWANVPARVCFGLSHWPVPPSRFPGDGWICVHGHIHNRRSGPLRVNCSVEAVGYGPVGLMDLLTPETLDDLAQRRRSGLDSRLAADPSPGDGRDSPRIVQGL